MRSTTFLFISLFYLFCCVFLNTSLDSDWINFFCLSIIILIGIPHGAIDNILFFQQSKLSKPVFYFRYLGIMLLDIILWLTIPVLAYTIFMLISAYHFGQSRFSDIYKSSKSLALITYFSWGTLILTALVLFNYQELNLIFISNADFIQFEVFYNKTLLYVLFIISFIFTLISLVIYHFRIKPAHEKFLIECIQLFFVILAFYAFPFFVGFTLFFIILHSAEVLKEEYLYLKEKNIAAGLSAFIYKLLPYSLLSLFGIVFIYFLSKLAWINISFDYCLLLIISSITVPHSVVMNNFYHNQVTTDSLHPLPEL